MWIVTPYGQCETLSVVAWIEGDMTKPQPLLGASGAAHYMTRENAEYVRDQLNTPNSAPFLNSSVKWAQLAERMADKVRNAT